MFINIKKYYKFHKYYMCRFNITVISVCIYFIKYNCFMTHTFHIFYGIQLITPNTAQNSVFKYNDLPYAICCVFFNFIK